MVESTTRLSTTTVSTNTVSTAVESLSSTLPVVDLQLHEARMLMKAAAIKLKINFFILKLFLKNYSVSLKDTFGI